MEAYVSTELAEVHNASKLDDEAGTADTRLHDAVGGHACGARVSA